MLLDGAGANLSLYLENTVLPSGMDARLRAALDLRAEVAKQEQAIDRLREDRCDPRHTFVGTPGRIRGGCGRIPGMGWLKIALVASVLAFAACGDGDPSTTPDAGAACGFVPDAGGCTPGGGQCVRGNRYPPPEAFVIICDPSCGDHGGCRDCVADQECEVELGAGAVCARPCGVCCRPDAVDGGPGTCPTCL